MAVGLMPRGVAPIRRVAKRTGNIASEKNSEILDAKSDLGVGYGYG